MWSLILDSFKTSFAQEVEFGEKGQLATHNLMDTLRSSTVTKAVPGGQVSQGVPTSLTFLDSPWAPGERLGSLAWHSRPPQPSPPTLQAASPPSDTLIFSLAEFLLAPRTPVISLSVPLHILVPLLAMFSACFFHLTNFYSSFKTQAQVSSSVQRLLPPPGSPLCLPQRSKKRVLI